MAMTSKERMKAAVNFKGPDRVPHMHCALPASFNVFEGLPELYKKYPSDLVGDGNLGPDDPLYKKGEWLDQWNCLWTVLTDGMLGQVTVHPLAEDDALNKYSWPMAADDDISAEVQAARDESDKYSRVGWLTFFERMVDLRGFEKTMMDIVDETPVFLEMHKQIKKYNMDMLDRLCALDADCVAFADDWGSQLNLMISPVQWKKLFLPVYEEMFDKVRRSGKHVYFHTDGYTMPILPYLTDAGVNIFWADIGVVNPMEELIQKLGGKVCFQSLTDVQFLIHNETTEGIKRYAKNIIEGFGSYGGGIIACHEIDPDQPWENVVAMLDAFREYGTYPIIKC